MHIVISFVGQSARKPVQRIFPPSFQIFVAFSECSIFVKWIGGTPKIIAAITISLKRLGAAVLIALPSPLTTAPRKVGELNQPR